MAVSYAVRCLKRLHHWINGPWQAPLVLSNQQIILRIRGDSKTAIDTLTFPKSMQDPTRNKSVVIFEYAFHPDGKGEFRYISENARDIFGIDTASLLADSSLIDSVFEGDDPGIFKRVDAGATSDVTAGVHANGAPRTVRVRYADQCCDNGVVVRRGIAEADIRTPKEDNGLIHHYEQLFGELPIGMVIHRGGRILFANKYAHSLIGARRPGELIGVNALDFVHPDYRSGIEDRIRHVSSGITAPMLEEKFICFDGRSVDVETMAFPFEFNGTPAIQVIFRDITERKKAEAHMRKNETLFRRLFQNVPLAVVRLDEHGKVSEVNKGFEDMFGFEKNELKGSNLNDFIVPDELRSEGIDLNNLIASNRVVSIESIRKHKSGELINVILCGVPVIVDYEPIGIYGVYVDITGRKKVEEELKIRNAELDNFVYKVSHDLRAPLSSVLGLVNLSKLQGNTDNPLEYIELIGEKILALDNFIGDVLSHSKNLKIEVSISEVDLGKIIEQTFADLGYLKGTRETKRSVKIEGLAFYSDHWRISEIFRNLISNSIKYRQPDADDSEIVIKIHVDHLCADISFADNGIGISEGNLKRIFEMFYRATEQSEGSGIGLYIVKNAVEKLGGQIKVASKQNQGTRFHILLPNRINSMINTPKNHSRDDGQRG